ncbi:MAG: hypothetical protein QOF89_3163 [Acidobacteriota bacterium]|nr:hypothetical protein [Acidobacteriota bacterium]
MTEPAELESPAELADLDELEGGFSRRRLAWVVGIAVASFAIFLLLLAFGRDLEGPPAPGPHTFSRSALGYQGVAELLRSLGLGVVSRQAPAGSGTGPTHPLVMAEPQPGRGGDSQRLEALWKEASDRQAPLVIVLPKWAPGDSRSDHKDWLTRVELMPIGEVGWFVRHHLGESGLGESGLPVVPQRLRRATGCQARWRTEDAPTPIRIEIEEAVQLLQLEKQEKGKGLEPIVQCDGGVLVARRPAAGDNEDKDEDGGRPQMVVIADPDLLNNHGLGRGENAAAVHQLLARSLEARGVVFDETIHGFNRTPGLLAEALRFPMVLGVMQGLLLLGFVLWAGMGRFGKPLPAALGLARGKEVLIGNTAELLSGGGHAADSVARYFQQTTRAVAAYYFVPADLPEGERLARLQRLAEGHGKRMSLAALELDIQRLPAGRRGEEQAAWIAQALYDWRLEMTNVDRKSS